MTAHPTAVPRGSLGPCPLQEKMLRAWGRAAENGRGTPCRQGPAPRRDLRAGGRPHPRPSAETVGSPHGAGTHLVLGHGGQRLKVVEVQVLAVLLIKIPRGRVHGLHPANAPAAPRLGHPGPPRAGRGALRRPRSAPGLAAPGLALRLGPAGSARRRVRSARLPLRLRAPGRHGNAPRAAPGPRPPRLRAQPVPAAVPPGRGPGTRGGRRGPGSREAAPTGAGALVPGAPRALSGAAPLGDFGRFLGVPRAGGQGAAGTVWGGAVF